MEVLDSNLSLHVNHVILLVLIALEIMEETIIAFLAKLENTYMITLAIHLALTVCMAIKAYAFLAVQQVLILMLRLLHV